jgi:multiple sugar transport system substrate-binding protein
VLGGGALAAAASALSSCAVGEGTAGGGNSIAFMYWGSTYEDAVVRQMLDAFTTDTGLPTSARFTPGSGDQYDTKLNVLIASGDAPDVLYSHEYMAFNLAERGLAHNLYPDFDKYPELANRFPGSYYFWEEDKCLGNETGLTVNCLYYMKPAFDAAGLEYPPATAEDAWEWDTFLENAMALTIDSNGKSPGDTGFNPDHVSQYGVSGFFNSNAWYAMVRANGGDLTSEDGTEYALDSPEAIEALQHLQDLIHTHHVSPIPKPGGSSGSDTSTDFRSGKVAMAFDGTWTMLNLNEQDIPYGIGVHPKHQESLSLQFSGCTMINGKTPIPEKATEFYLYHNDPRNLPELFTSGLWLPLDMKYYTEPEDIAFWTDNENHPPEFRTAVMDYMQTNTVTSFIQRLRNMSRIRDVLFPAIEVIQQGHESA